MKHPYSVVLAALFVAPLPVAGQGIYFPPNTGNTWETVDPATLGWCTDQIPPLLDFLGTNNTKAFIILKDGRIAIEHYFGTFTQDSVWYWASAGKSLTATLVGKAQEEGFLNINDPSIDYLGAGWTTCTPAQEAAITIRHQLTMTTGLDDSGDNNCTDPACLHYLADPDTRWAYHTGAYTKLDGVLNAATGQTINAYLFSKLTQTMGLTGLYITLDYDHVFFSTPRNMARFGLLAMNGGNWNGNQVLNTTYFNEMVSPSQALNNSYGYLWWLNGQSSFMAPGSQLVFPGELMPNEPAEAFNALGKNGQSINVVPSQGLVVIRMGDSPGPSQPVAFLFNNDTWAYLNNIFCTPTAVQSAPDQNSISIFPSPASEQLRVNTAGRVVRSLELFAADGRRMDVALNDNTIDVSAMAPGIYAVRVVFTDGTVHKQRFEVAR
ncbi:MAG: serine hydrolase [Flavobacteriales bacterium]